MAALALAPIVGGLIKDVFDRIIPDKAKAAELAAQATAQLTQERLEQLHADLSLALGQIEINKVEAANPRLFVSGWRPAIGWTCAVALFCYYVPYTIVATALWAIQVYHTGSLVPRPDLGVADLLGLCATMLGTATLRTAEKFKGVAAI
jgi:hypothetical protein